MVNLMVTSGVSLKFICETKRDPKMFGRIVYIKMTRYNVMSKV